MLVLGPSYIIYLHVDFDSWTHPLPVGGRNMLGRIVPSCCAALCEDRIFTAQGDRAMWRIVNLASKWSEWCCQSNPHTCMGQCNKTLVTGRVCPAVPNVRTYNDNTDRKGVQELWGAVWRCGNAVDNLFDESLSCHHCHSVTQLSLCVWTVMESEICCVLWRSKRRWNVIA